jgi:hypothetical protein
VLIALFSACLTSSATGPGPVLARTISQIRRDRFDAATHQIQHRAASKKMKRNNHSIKRMAQLALVV